MAVLFVLASGCSSDEVERSPCERVRDHVVELRMSEVHVATGVDRDAHRLALTDALGDDFIARCKASLGAEQVSCVLAASDAESAAACAR